MSNVAKLLMLVLCFGCLGSCKDDVDKVLRRQMADVDGKVEVISVESSQLKRVERWIPWSESTRDSVASFLLSGDRVWKTSYVTFAPSFMVYLREANINVHDTEVILNLQIRAGVTRQYVSPCSLEEKKRLMRELGF